MSAVSPLIKQARRERRSKAIHWSKRWPEYNPPTKVEGKCIETWIEGEPESRYEEGLSKPFWVDWQRALAGELLAFWGRLHLEPILYEITRKPRLIDGRLHLELTTPGPPKHVGTVVIWPTQRKAQEWKPGESAFKKENR